MLLATQGACLALMHAGCIVTLYVQVSNLKDLSLMVHGILASSVRPQPTALRINLKLLSLQSPGNRKTWTARNRT